MGEDGAWLEAARYVHLNPVRVARLGLAKADQQRQRTLAARDPGEKLVAERLRLLRSYRWSSYGAYAREGSAPDWLTTEVLLGAAGGRTLGEKRKAFREFHQTPLREGRLAGIWERLFGGAVLGSEDFVAEVKKLWQTRPAEEARSQEFKSVIRWETIVETVESVHGSRWAEFRDQHGDWGRDMALYLGRKHGRLRLTELGALAGGLSYTAVAQALSRVTKDRSADRQWQERLHRISAKLYNVKM